MLLLLLRYCGVTTERWDAIVESQGGRAASWRTVVCPSSKQRSLLVLLMLV
jgi:hypothetical protein